MSLKAFLEGYRAARNGPSGQTERLEQPWAQGQPPEWINEPMPQDTDTELVKLQHSRALAECEKLRRAVAGRDAELAECRAVIAELWAKNEENTQRLDVLTAELARVKETRDRYQTNGKKAAAARDAAQARIAQLESVLGFPGVKKALLKAVHPDMHPQASASERRALDEMSRTVNAVYDTMEPKA